MKYKIIILNNDITGAKVVFLESWDTLGNWKFILVNEKGWSLINLEIN